MFEYTRLPPELQLAVFEAADELTRYLLSWGDASHRALFRERPFTGLSFSRACALDGHLSLLKWAVEQGCGVDHNVLGFAANGGHVEVRRHPPSLFTFLDSSTLLPHFNNFNRSKSKIFIYYLRSQSYQ